MSKHFTHLHLHTEYSLLDGAIGLDALIGFGKKHAFKSLAITDHGNVFGAVKFFQKCKKAGIKPILGMEAYTTPNARIKSAENKYYHLVLLVQNNQGYRNLCKLISFSYREGFYFKPRIDYEMLKTYSEGLIALSGCLGGHIPQLLILGHQKEAEDQLDHFVDIFGSDRFFLEVQPEDQNDQVILNEKIFALSAKKNIPIVATGDCHYLNADDRQAHEVMLAIQTQDKMSNNKRYTFGDCRVHMRTAQEMCSIFPNNEEIIWRTGEIADRCEFDFETGKLFFPSFPIPQNSTPEQFFKKLCLQGLERLLLAGRIAPDENSIYEKRLNEEMQLIIDMGFVGYFLVVSDFIQWAYRNNIPVGPGRGSAAGSLVAWTLQITNINPIKYNLLFERFLNPERVSMPDIDIDFCIEGREKVIEYIKQKYGQDKVCHIITFGTMLAKGVIKDVARVLGFSFEDSNAITSLIPDQLKITLTEALAQEPRLRELVDNNENTKKLFDIAFKLEGLTRHASKHAAGIVISPEPVDEVLPLYVPSKTNELVSQYAMSELEAIGFLKIDLLGLKNLTLIDRVIHAIQKSHGIVLDCNNLPLDDLTTFNLICAGNTSGVFQLESDGLKDVLRKLAPDKFEDIIAVNALYRPGPLGSGTGMIDDFIARRHGHQQIKYIFDELGPILEETYGVIVYQEQVIKIASVIAGYSLGEADILRRAMGKKKAEVMAEQRTIFLSRAVSKGFDEKKSGELFDLMEYFAGYGFNKSHSAAYALIAYQTAYLKANYPSEFMACLISLEVTNPDKMVFYLQEARQNGLSIVPPDINRSQIDFSVIDGGILFGLQGIKNVGSAALENIIMQRSLGGAFSDMIDFCKRVDLRVVNKRVIENLICAGACDGLAGTRAQKFCDIVTIIDQATSFKKDAHTGQMGLFSLNASVSSHTNVPSGTSSYTFSSIADWDNKERLLREKEAIGFYVSMHPLMEHEALTRWLQVFSFGRFREQIEEKKMEESITIRAVGLLKKNKQITTKKGDRMAFLLFEDMHDSAEVIVFPKLFTKIQHELEEHRCFFITGVLDNGSTNQCKIKAERVVLLDQFWNLSAHFQKNVSLTLPRDFEESTLSDLEKLLSNGSVQCKFELHENDQTLQIVPHKKFVFDSTVGKQIERLGVKIIIDI